MESEQEFDHSRDIGFFYQTLQNLIVGQVSDTVNMGRNIFCYCEKPLSIPNLFRIIEIEMKAKLALWTATKTTTRRTFMPIQVTDEGAMTVNEWLDKHQRPIRKSLRLV
jgi:hypothetical protein